MGCTIRLTTAADADQISSIYAPFVTRTAITFEVDVPTADEMERRIADTMEAMPWLVCERDREVLGYAYAVSHRKRAAYQWSVESSVYIREHYHRRGIGRALYSALFKILKLQRFCNVYGGVTLPNPASVCLHETFGFEKIGVYPAIGYKFGAWHDVGWWHLRLRDRPAEPAPPLNMNEVCKDPAFAAALDTGLQFVRV